MSKKLPIVSWNTTTITQKNYTPRVSFCRKSFVQLIKSTSNGSGNTYEIFAKSKGLAKIKITALSRYWIPCILKSGKEIMSTFYVLVQDENFADKKESGDRY